jgi:hypothetical protein
MYKQTQTGAVLRIHDAVLVPDDPLNSDWQEYQKWLSAGGVPEPANQAPTVPVSVTMKQAQLALLAAGKLDAVDGLIAAQARAVRVVWATSPTVERSNPLVASIGTSLGLTDAQIDALFEQAAKL